MDLSINVNVSTDIGQTGHNEQNDPKIPEWHKQILEEPSEKYETGKNRLKNWDEVQKDL
ncbi:MAG TPA: addiction module protein [Chitinophagales bacterium]|nr:addiction module protein [Chitinophagales bacterium]